jgi:pimeloyl-ACP methyl ester carboxylesterase
LASYLGLSLSGFHRLAYWEWGRRDAKRTLICVHGLTRQGRDFDFLARTFARRGWRVICPDLVGRGHSGWLAHPAGYTLLQYGADMNALLARLDVEEVDWVGNSLGGLIAMMLAAQPGTPIRRLVINDIPTSPVRPCAASASTSTPRRRGSPISPRPSTIFAPRWPLSAP